MRKIHAYLSVNWKTARVFLKAQVDYCLNLAFVIIEG